MSQNNNQIYIRCNPVSSNGYSKSNTNNNIVNKKRNNTKKTSDETNEIIGGVFLVFGLFLFFTSVYINVDTGSSKIMSSLKQYSSMLYIFTGVCIIIGITFLII